MPAKKHAAKNPKRILLTGGCRSGKSGFALHLSQGIRRRAFLATAEAIDREMEQRIQKHKKDRGSAWTTIEEPVDLAGAVKKHRGRFDLILIDCITIWASNLLLQLKPGGRKKAIREFLDVVEDPGCTLVLVTNEVGSGVVPANKLAREFRDLAGDLNQKIAKRCDEVYLLAAGIPLKLKGD